MVSINPDFKLSEAKREERKKQASIFPNQISLGSFTPHSTIVEVACFRTDVVRPALAKGNLLNVRRDLQVLCHEMTHWFDFIGTRWGRHYATNISKAFRAIERGGELEFPHLVTLFDLDRRVLSPTYYRYANPPRQLHDKDRPWSIDFSCGAEIDPAGCIDDRKPIFFVKFGENPSRETFARQPISIGALLEVRAIASELEAGALAIMSEVDEGTRIVESAAMTREFSDLIYDHRLIEYNSAAHVLARHAGSKDLNLTCSLASRLAFIALNLGSDDFRNLRPPKDFETFGKRNKAFLQNQDRGYAFACMVWNGGQYEGDDEEYVARCLRKSNLDTAQAILKRSASDLAKPLWIGGVTPLTEHFVREAMMGGVVCEALAEQRNYIVTMEMLGGKLRAIAPPFMDSKGDFVEFNEGRLGEYDPDRLHDSAHMLRKITRNLLSGCRGLQD